MHTNVRTHVCRCKRMQRGPPRGQNCVVRRNGTQIVLQHVSATSVCTFCIQSYMYACIDTSMCVQTNAFVYMSTNDLCVLAFACSC